MVGVSFVHGRMLRRKMFCYKYKNVFMLFLEFTHEEKECLNILRSNDDSVGKFMV